MKLYAVAMMAHNMKKGTISIYVRSSIANSADEATGIGYRNVYEKYPVEDGYTNHVVVVSEIDDETMLEVHPEWKEKE